MKESESIGNYVVRSKLGKGSFGTVYEVENVVDKKLYAMKLENSSANKLSQLKNEYRMYQDLAGCPGVPKAYYLGIYGNRYYLILERLGMSLQDIYDAFGKKYTIKTICMIGKRMVRSFEAMHNRNIIYRDLKPENILVGFEERDLLYLVDFGMAKYYVDPSSNEHIPFITNKKLTGTARYASINTHKGFEQSRRDDLEGLGYTLVYFLRGALPWIGLHAPTGKEKYELIGDVKMNTKSSVLCSCLPGEVYLVKYFDHVKNLSFTEKPNYNYLYNCFERILADYMLFDDGRFDWLTRWVECSSKSEGKKKRNLWSRVKSFLRDCSTDLL